MSSEGNFTFFASKHHEISPKNTCIERKKLSSIRLNHPQPVALPSKRATDQSSMAEQTPKRPKRGTTTPSSADGTHYARVNVDDAIYERIQSFAKRFRTRHLTLADKASILLMHGYLRQDEEEEADEESEEEEDEEDK